MSESDRLALSITHADGSVTRWGGDEPGAGDIPRGLKFGTSVPGGFKDCSCSLARRIDLAYPDLQLFDDVRVYGPGNETAWEGRQQQFPRQQGSDFSIDIGAVGWSAHLEDNTGFREIYVDRDPARLAGLPLDRALLITSGAVSVGDFDWQQQAGGQFLGLPNHALGAQVAADTWALYPPGLKISKVMYRGATTSLPAGWQINLRATDALPTAGETYSLTFDDTLRTQTLTTAARKDIALQVYSNGNAVTPAAGALVRATKFAAYGNHGLTTHTISGDPDGVYASDVMADIVTRAAPKLTFTTGASGSIQPTIFAIPHLVFLDPVTGAAAIALVNGFHLYDWAVWAGKAFHFRPSDPDTATVWEARLSDGAQIQLEGDQAADVWNGVIVNYTDPTGTARSVGPAGSATDTQNSALASSDPTNPVNRAGLTRWQTIDLSVPTTDAGAIQLGAVWLAEHALPQRRGQIVMTGTATCVQSGWRNQPLGQRPAWAPRAGDYVRIADQPGDTPRKIIETGYDHDPRTNTLSVGTTPFKLEAIIERLNAQLVGVL